MKETTLAQKILILRSEQGWTQQELARACGLTQSVIGRLESKRSVPTLVTLQKIVSALGASLSVVEQKAG